MSRKTKTKPPATLDRRRSSRDGYEASYFAFVDILGFSELVARSQRDRRLFAELKRTLERVCAVQLNWVRQSRPTGRTRPTIDICFRSQAFSDSVILSSRRNPVGLLTVLENARQLCFALLGLGVLTRGGIAVGRLYHDDLMAFGPAFIAAYLLETRAAKYPRVVLEDAVVADIADLKVGGRPLTEIIRLDFDGLYHLDYLGLRSLFQTADGDSADPSLAEVRGLALDAIRLRIVRGMRRTLQLDTRAKHMWLARYFNEAVAKHHPRSGVRAISMPSRKPRARDN